MHTIPLKDSKRRNGNIILQSWIYMYMNPFACAYIFVKFTYLIQLNFVVQILVFQGIGAWFSYFLIFNQELEFDKKKKKKIN